jgi:hypothetical protein
MRRGFLEQRFAEHGHGIHDLFAIVEDEKNGFSLNRAAMSGMRSFPPAGSPSAVATVPGTRSGSLMGARSMKLVSTPLLAKIWRATAVATVVFPMPPGPVRVMKRCCAMLPAIVAIASSRPTMLLRRAGMEQRPHSLG